MTVYEVDLNRLVIKLTQKNGGSYVYTYDPVHRLTGITTPLGLTFLIDSGGYDRAAFELGRIVGNAAAIAAIFGMFFAGGGAISGAFMGGAMALTLGAAGAATLEIAAGATVVAAKGNSIAEALNSLMSEMSGASNFGGKGTEEEGESNSDLGNYEFKEGIDEDLRGGKGTFEEALEKAFEKTGTPKEDFTVTKWGKDQYGKSHPVEWRASNGAEVSVDIGHSVKSGAPTADHIGWQTGGKRSSGGGVRGHIFVDEVPYNVYGKPLVPC